MWYLKEYRIGTYTTLLTSGRLNVYLADVDKQAQERIEKARRTNETVTRYHRAAKGGKRIGMDTENE